MAFDILGFLDNLVGQQRQKPAQMPPPAGPVSPAPGATPNNYSREPDSGLARRGADEAPGSTAAAPGAPAAAAGAGPGHTAPPMAASGPGTPAMPAPGPFTTQAQTHAATPPPALHGWKNVLDTVGRIATPQIESQIPGTPGNYVAKQEQLDKLASDEQSRATAASTQQRESREAAKIVNPVPLYAAPGTPNAGEQVGEKGYDSTGQYHENMYPSATQAAQQPTVGQESTPNAPAQQSSPGRSATTTMKPLEPQRAPLPTAEEAAKLAPVKERSTQYNSQIADLPDINAKDFPIGPETTTEQAEKTLADARAESAAKRAEKSAEHVADAPAAAEKEKERHNFGYTVDENGSVVYTTEAKAGDLGAPFEPMTPADVKKDRDTLGLMGNVQLNASAYKTAVQQIPGPIPADHSALMQRILADPKLDSGAILNAVDLGAAASIIAQGERATAWNKLTPPEQNAVTQYLRAKGAVVAYQRALTNQGRTNPEALMIELDTIPEPYVGATVALPRFDSFQSNIDQVSQRLPSNLPGVASVKSIRDKTEGSKAGGGLPSGAVAGTLNGKHGYVLNGEFHAD